MARVPAKPFGNTYFTNADGFSIINREGWIISAGPNGQMKTPAFINTLFGDDIGLRIK